jgi:hypothetical protein
MLDYPLEEVEISNGPTCDLADIKISKGNTEE